MYALNISTDFQTVMYKPSWVGKYWGEVLERT